VSGRDFRIGLQRHDDGALRIEVTDGRGDRVPRILDPVAEDSETVWVCGLRSAVCGLRSAVCGLRIVAAYARSWGVDQAPANARTVWAELTPGRGKA
jgi:hypothetical protein